MRGERVAWPTLRAYSEEERSQRVLSSSAFGSRRFSPPGQRQIMEDVVIVGGARTAMAEYGGAFKDVSAIELGAQAAKAALERSGARPEWVDQAVFGNALQTSGDAIYGARHVALKAGVPIETPALTVNRLCGSGIQSVVSAAHMIRLGESRLALAGGMENMTQAPHVIRGA